jgi:hypothetical protein
MGTAPSSARLPINQVVATIPVCGGSITADPFSLFVYVTDGTEVTAVNTFSLQAETYDIYTDSGEEIIATDPSPYNLSAISPDGTMLYVVGVLGFYNPYNGTWSYAHALIGVSLAALEGFGGYTLAAYWILPDAATTTAGLAVSPDGTEVYVITDAGYIVVANAVLGTNQFYNPIDVSGNPIAVNFSPDGSTAYVLTNSNISFIQTIDVATGTASSEYIGAGEIVTGNVQFMAVSPNGSEVFVSDWADYLAAIKIGTNRLAGAASLISPGDGDVQLGQPAVTPNGAFVYVPNLNDQTVLMVDAATCQVKGSPIPVGQNPVFTAISPLYSNYLYVVNTNVPGQATMSVIDITVP